MRWPPTSDDLTRLRDTLAWVAEHSPYYRRAFADAGVRLADLRTYDDLRAPACRARPRPTWSANQRAHPPFGEFLAVPREEFASLHTSPGPISSRGSRSERGGTPVLKEAIEAMGVRPGDVAHVTLSYHIMPGGLRLHRAFEEAGCLVINGGTGASQLQVEVARAWGATVYAGTPSFLANLGDTAREHGPRPAPRPALPRRLLDRRGADAGSCARELGDTFGIELFDHCGEAQIGPLAGECRAHEGMHLHARDLFCEFLDPETGEPVEPGRHRRAGRDAARTARAAARALRAGRRLPAAAGRVRVRRPVAAHRLRRPGGRDPQDQGRPGPSGAGARALSELPGARPLPDRRRASARASATTAPCCASA